MQLFPYDCYGEECGALLDHLKVSSAGIKIMEHRFGFSTFIITDISATGANVLKQQLLSLGGEAAVPRNSIKGGDEKVTLLFSLRDDKFPYLIMRLRQQWWGLKDIGISLEEWFAAKAPWFDFSLNQLNRERPAVMAILNTTPDSFSDGGRFLALKNGIKHAASMIDAGADIIDVGGESTRPGADAVDHEEEIRRTAPLIREIREIDKNIPISIDTTKAKVAEKAILAGANIINDISGLSFEPELAKVAAESGAALVLMHIQGTPRTMQQNPEYENVISEINSFFDSAVEKALQGGVKKDKIILDPGIGFGKSLNHNLFILKHLNSFLGFRLPLLVGASRKSYIGKVCERENPEKRVAGTVASNMTSLERGAAIIRVHDVEEGRDTVKMYHALKESKCC